MRPGREFVFGIANVAVIRFALGGVTGDQRLLWTAVWIFVVANWIAQDYLAPQAAAPPRSFSLASSSLWAVRAASGRAGGHNVCDGWRP